LFIELSHQFLSHLRHFERWRRGLRHFTRRIFGLEFGLVDVHGELRLDLRGVE
jgi:hypothetical protein